jgi:hypothetical protein
MRGGDVKTMTGNITPEDDTSDLRKAFSMALADALKTGEKVPAMTLEVIRKYLADQDQDRRWRVEQSQLAGGASLAGAGTAGSTPAATPATSGASSGASNGATETYPEDYIPPVPAGLDLSKLPFPSVKRRGVEQPPKKAGETTDSDKQKDWTGLAQVPFLSPDH